MLLHPHASADGGPKVRARPPPSLPACLRGTPDTVLVETEAGHSVSPRAAVPFPHVAADEDEALSSSKSLTTGSSRGGRERGRGRGERYSMLSSSCVFLLLAQCTSHSHRMRSKERLLLPCLPISGSWNVGAKGTSLYRQGNRGSERRSNHCRLLGLQVLGLQSSAPFRVQVTPVPKTKLLWLRQEANQRTVCLHGHSTRGARA